MSVKKFYAKSDTTITNAYKGDLTSRAVESNMGLSDSMEVFFIFGQVPDENAELAQKLEESRIIISFDMGEIRSHYNNVFPDSAKFILKLSNAEHPYTLARNYDMKIYSLQESFVEGTGLDMETYLDEGGSSWSNRDIGSPWTTPGAINYDEQGVIINDLVGTQRFENGDEDLEVDVTSHIKKYFDNLQLVDNGFAIVMDESLTSGISEQNYYTKKFFSRSSQFFFKRPAIEVRQNDALLDDRNNFFRKSPVHSEDINKQRIYLYNSVEGELLDYTKPSQNHNLFLRLYTDESRETIANTDADGDFISVTPQGNGAYYAEVILEETDAPEVYDRWYFATQGDAAVEDWIVVHESKFDVKTRTSSTSLETAEYVSKIVNMKNSYSTSEKARFRIYTRAKDWSPTIYTVASRGVESLIVEKIYYKIIRVSDGEEVIPYGLNESGVNNSHTMTSYDFKGNYFDLDMSLLEPGYMYGIKLIYLVDGERKEAAEVFKFRVN